MSFLIPTLEEIEDLDFFFNGPADSDFPPDYGDPCPE